MTRTAVRGAFVLALALGACRKAPEPLPTAAAPASAERAVDQAAPGELAEGSERAFGLPIPRRMRVEAAFPDAVFAVGTLAPEHVANYVRERVVAEGVETGPSKTVFSKAKVKGAAEQRVVRIEVVLRPTGTTELVVRDHTPPPVKQGVTPDERMREHGMTPSGKVLDKSRLQ